MVYDLAFIFDECGFGDLPEHIERERLYNVSFDADSGEIKLYVLDRSERFAYKISAGSITRQYAGDDREHGGDHRKLCERLQCELDERQIVIDAVEEDNYYVYVDDASPAETVRLTRAVCRAFGVAERRLLESTNAIAAGRFNSLEESAAAKAVSLVRVPLAGPGAKIYARPFLRGGGCELNERTRRFLTRLYRCEESELTRLLIHAWVAKELESERTSVVTQYHALLHRD